MWGWSLSVERSPVPAGNSFTDASKVVRVFAWHRRYPQRFNTFVNGKKGLSTCPSARTVGAGQHRPRKTTKGTDIPVSPALMREDGSVPAEERDP
ncbi:hypothetical protein GCM10010140_48390 [Streptosporangium pseudovulgare]|uniref:Uncharacterized protein n=1 Tax=Streptosporangium pseudovulgare TaxID=35765 RepID=A0ABQ2R5W0_9ACTN|nr:hypothetical protein GCM10010140_48390 [Streptosporangium pseudovulgare]